MCDGAAQKPVSTVGVGVKRPAYGFQPEVALAEQRQITADVLEEVGELDRPHLEQPPGIRSGQGEHLADSDTSDQRAAPSPPASDPSGAHKLWTEPRAHHLSGHAIDPGAA
jgi:hypothetical protein